MAGLAVLDQSAAQPAAAAGESGLAPGGTSGNSGAFTSQVPLQVPAFHGLQPALGLVYDSEGGNGLVGVGWQLTAESFIERATPGRGAPTYGSSDIFLLDGEELVPSTTLGGTHVTKRQSFLKISFDATNNTWTVWQRDGVKTTYAPGHTVGTNVFRWVRSSVVDTYGNTVNYSYWCDPSNYCYVDKILYNGTTITLYRESRPDPITFAAGGQAAKIAYRIKTVDIVTNSSRVRAYKLSYGTSSTTSRSLLTSVQMFGTDATLDASGTVTGGTSMPAVSLGYRTDATPHDLNVVKMVKSDGTAFTNWCVGTSGYFGSADFNRDGKDDFWCHNDATALTQVGLTNGMVVPFTAQDNWCTANFVYSVQYGLGDFNGDGLKDFYCHDINDEKIALSDGDGTFTVVSEGGGFCTDASWRVGIGEFNGDGKTDFWCHDQVNGTTKIALNNGANGFSVAAGLTAWCTTSNRDFDVADLNGDGRTDLWCHDRTNGDLWTAQSKGDGSFTTYAKFGSWCTAGPPYGFGTVDHNGDGKADFFCHGMGDGNTWVATSNGNNSFSTYAKSMSWCTGDATVSFGMDADFNGDGRSDTWCHVSGNGNTYLAFATGESSFQDKGLAASACLDGPPYEFGVGDFNGDGKSDFWCHDATSGNTWVAKTGSVVGRTDLLASQTTGLGGKRTMAYSAASAFTNVWLAPSMPMVISTVSDDDGRGTVATTAYNYTGARYDPVERRSLGFETVYASDATGAGSTTVFRQLAGYPTGRVIQVDRKSAAGTLLERSGMVYAESASGGVYTSQLSAQTHAMCVNATCQTSQINYGYDTYGNVNLVKLYGDTAVTGDERTVGTTYTYDTTKYIVGTPSLIKTYAGIGTTGTVGKQASFTYNTAGDPITSSEWLSSNNSWNTSKATYDTYGNVATTSNPLDAAASKATLTHTFDSTYHMFPTKVCDLLNHCTSSAWNVVLQVATSDTDVNGKTTSFTYDAVGRLTKETRPDSSVTTHTWANLGNAGTQFQHDAVSDGTADGLWSRTYFDGLGRAYKQQGEPDILQLTDYDTQGQVKRVSLPYRSGGTAKWTSYAYDALGRLTTVTNPDNTKRQTSYTVAVNAPDPDFATPKYRVSACDEVGTCNSTTFNGYGQQLVTSDITPGWANEYRSRSTYDVWGRLSTLADNVGSKTTYGYDSLDRRTSVDDPDMGTWTYGYDKNSRLSWQKDARGQQTDVTYDEVGRIKKEANGTTTLATYTYDEAGHGASVGRLTSLSDISGATSWTYDSRGRVGTMVKTVDTVDYSVSQTFDSAGRRKSLTYPGGEVVTYAYNAEGCLTQVGPYVTAATCTAAGQVASRTFGNGITQSWTYDADRLWLTGDTTKTSGGTVLQSETYGYNDVGQVTSKTSGDTNDQWTYGYDGLGRMKSATDSANSAWNVSATYDAAGRVSSKTGSGGSYTYPTVNTAGKPDHAPSSVGTRNYTYDANGNRTSDGTTTLDYNALNRMVRTTTGGVATTYSYDAFGDRVKSGNIVTISLGGQQLLRVNGSTTMKYYYYGSERVASQDNNGTFHYYVSDHLGSAHLLLNNDGTTAKRTVYNPFGTVVSQSGTYSDPFGLAGAEADASGLTHLGVRYYDPVIGEFTSPDPTGAGDPFRPQSLNRYAYAGNDPVNNVDPSGFTTRPVGNVYKASWYRTVYNPRQNILAVEIDFTIKDAGFEFTYSHDFDEADVDTMNLRFANPHPRRPDFNVNWRFSRNEYGVRLGFSKAFGLRNADGHEKALSVSLGAGLSANFNWKDGTLESKAHTTIQGGQNIKYPQKIGRFQDTGTWSLFKVHLFNNRAASAGGAGSTAPALPQPAPPQPADANVSPADANAAILELLPGVGPGMVNDLSAIYHLPGASSVMTSIIPGGAITTVPATVDVPHYRLDLTPVP